MFSLVSGLYDTYLSPKELRVVLVGANGVGKTALLERLKVTDFSSIQSKASASSTMTTERPLPPPEILLALSDCAGMPPLDGSTQKGSHSAKPNDKSSDNKTATSSSSTTKPEPAASSANQTKLTTVAPSPTATAVAPTKPKRRLFFCPAPKRYAKSKDDDESDGDEEELMQLPAPETTTTTNRERTHSQEFSVSSLDLMDNNTGEPDEGAFQTIPVSSTSEQQPVSDEPAIPKQNSLQVIGNDSNSNPQEYHKLPNKKMLPLHKIRPTSESTYNKHQLMSMYIPDL